MGVQTELGHPRQVLGEDRTVKNNNSYYFNDNNYNNESNEDNPIYIKFDWLYTKVYKD